MEKEKVSARLSAMARRIVNKLRTGQSPTLWATACGSASAKLGLLPELSTG